MSNAVSNDGLHDQQTDAIEQLSALRATVDAEILRLIRAADESEVWQVDGSPNLVEWVTWRCRVSRAEARKLVEVAQALAELPRIAAGLDDGSLSYSQVCILVDFVGPDGDAEWAERARGMHVEQLRAWRRAARRVTTEEADDGPLPAFAGVVVGPGPALPEPQGKTPSRAGRGSRQGAHRLSPRADAPSCPTEPTTGPSGAGPMRSSSSPRPTSPTTPIRTGPRSWSTSRPTALVSDEGAAALEGGCELAPETVRRLACEASIQTIVTHNGRSIGVGRKTRTPPPWLRRLVVKRDGFCRFPGVRAKTTSPYASREALDARGADRSRQPRFALQLPSPVGARGRLEHPRETGRRHGLREARRTRLRGAQTDDSETTFGSASWGRASPRSRGAERHGSVPACRWGELSKHGNG